MYCKNYEDKFEITLERLFDDIKQTADSMELEFDELKTRKVLSAFSDEFKKCVVQFKSTDKNDDGLYYRFFYRGNKDLTSIALNHGLISKNATSALALQPEILMKLPDSTRAGLDFHTKYGFAKEWTFTGLISIEDFLSTITQLPDSVYNKIDYFKTHQLNRVLFTAVDVINETMNVYFHWDHECRNRAWIKKMAASIGAKVPLSSECDKIINSQVNVGGVGVTFRWDSSEIERWCLYSLNIPMEDYKFPMDHSLEFLKNIQILNKMPQYNVAWSFSKDENYLKLEKSYAKDATWFLTKMGGDLSPVGKTYLNGFDPIIPKKSNLK